MAGRDLMRPQAPPDPTVLHPAAQKAAAAYSDAMNENEALRDENRQLLTQLELAKRHNVALERQLEVERSNCDRFRSYAVEIRTRLATIVQIITAAHEAGVAFNPPKEAATSPDIERMIADAAAENVQKGESP